MPKPTSMDGLQSYASLFSLPSLSLSSPFDVDLSVLANTTNEDKF